jgi:tetratricopeptide (TPR) repeat protein
MMARSPDPKQVHSLLAKRDFSAALPLAVAWSVAAPRVASAWLARAQASLGLGRLREAHEALERSVQLGAEGTEVKLLRAILDHRLGRSTQAIDSLRNLINQRGTHATEATIALAEVLHRANRFDELEELMDGGGEWLRDPRAEILSARVMARRDPQGTIEHLDSVARANGPPWLRRIAGFDAVRMLDAQKQYRRAFDLASFLHASTGAPFDGDGLLANAAAQIDQLVKYGRKLVAPALPPQLGSALVVGMPRSGTTLLEQMLDRHPGISGIGEYDGIVRLGEELISIGRWPDSLPLVTRSQANEMRQSYLAGTALIQRAGTTWTFDKSLSTWHWLPAVATILPGAVCVRMQRCARDNAISIFLGNFNPRSFGWSASLDSIRRVMAAERRLAPLAFNALGIAHEQIQYESLVAQPREHMERVLARLGLPMHEATISPQDNARTVLTLSHEQVRRPINRASIGRWRNYAWAFDRSWEELDDEDACRTGG